jgi:hypothetical protein
VARKLAKAAAAVPHSRRVNTAVQYYTARVASSQAGNGKPFESVRRPKAKAGKHYVLVTVVIATPNRAGS